MASELILLRCEKTIKRSRQLLTELEKVGLDTFQSQPRIYRPLLDLHTDKLCEEYLRSDKRLRRTVINREILYLAKLLKAGKCDTDPRSI